MRYWLLFLLKILAAAGLLSVLWMLAVLVSPHAPRGPASMALAQVPWKLPWALTIGGFVVLSCGLLHACLLDQRFRCRVCCRRLRMPVRQGSWSRALTDRPSTEYICPYGHGKLLVPEAQLTGFEFCQWTVYGDFWQELFAKRPAAGVR